MNINDNQLNKEIEALKEESSPSTLQARIIGSILEPQKSNNIMTKRILGFGLSTLVVGAIAFGAVMAPRIATAADVKQVSKAFEETKKYRTTTYEISNGKRTRISESWFDGNKRDSFLVSGDGTLTKVPDVLTKAQGKISAQLYTLTPKDLVDEKMVGSVIIMIVGDQEYQAVQVPSVPPQLEAGQVPRSGMFVFMNPDQNGGSQVAVMPAFFGGEVGIESLGRLLQDEWLWTITRNVELNGKATDRYELASGTFNLLVFVDPSSKLPILTRQTVEIKGNPVVTEVEYDYSGSEPPKLTK